MTWTHYTFGRTRSDPAPQFRPEPPKCAPARSLAELLEESTGLARSGAAAVCWDGTLVAVVQVHIAGTDAEGRPQSEVRIRERETDPNGFAGSCLALFHKRPIESEAVWDHATLEIADRGHDRLAGPTLSALAELWAPTHGARIATIAAPTIGVREEAADVCLTIRAIAALCGLPGPAVVAHSVRSFGSTWASEAWWTLLVATDAATPTGPSSFAHVQRFLEANPRGFTELEYYAEKLLEPPSLERLQRAVFIATAIDESARTIDGGPTFVDLPRLIDLQRRTESRSPTRVWEVIRAQLHTTVASDRFAPAPDAETQVHGYVGDSHAVILELGVSSLATIERVRDLLGERVAEQVRLAIEQRLPVEDAIRSASKTVAQQSNHVVKLRLSREPEQVIAEIRGLPPSAKRRAELSALVCDLFKADAPLDFFLAARRTPSDRVASGLTTLAPRWGGPPEALHQPVSQLDAEWLVQYGEAILMTARRVGAEAFAFWVPILVEALLRSTEPPPRLTEALLRTNQVGLDDSAALIRHSPLATDFVRNRALELWASGHKLMGLEPWLPRPTTPLLEESWDRLPEPADDKPPNVEGYTDPFAALLWGFAARVRHGRRSLEWARQAAELVSSNADLASIRALLHHGSTWLPFARDLWIAGYGRLLEGVPFDASHMEYIARDVQADQDVTEGDLLAAGTPAPMADLAAERLIPWLRATRWAASTEKPPFVLVVEAWQSNDEGHRRAVCRYGWSMVDAHSEEPRSAWLDRAWRAWRERAEPHEAPVQFLRSFPAFLQLELVALGHVSLSEVEVMPKTSLPLINVFLFRSAGTYEAAVLYEIPVASTWSLVATLPPGVLLPEALSTLSGEQQEVLQRAATALDEMTMPFCLGVWNHSALSWKEGRHAWVSSDGRVVCLNTDREPPWYEPMRNGFGGEPTQRMLAVAAVADAPDEMLETMPRARIVGVTRGGARRTPPGAGLFGSGKRALWLTVVGVALLLGVVVFAVFWSSETELEVKAPVVAVSPQEVAAEGAVPSDNGTPAPAADTPCPFSAERACSMLRPQAPGAATFCEVLRSNERPYASVLANPAQGPRCLRRRRNPKVVVAEYGTRNRADDAQFEKLVEELVATACDARRARGCTTDDCGALEADLTASILDLLAKRLARTLHIKSADKAVPDLSSAMPYALIDPRRRTGQAWLAKAMPVSCSWLILEGSEKRLANASAAMTRDFDRLKDKLPSHAQMMERIRKPN